MGLSGILSKGVPASLPRFTLFLRIAIVVLSVVVLALAAFALSVFGSYAGYYGGYSGVSGLLIFVVIKTWLIFGILALFEYRLPQYYFRIVAVIAYAFSIVFWLSAWAWSASNAAFWLSNYCYGGYCYDGDSYAKKEGGALAACAGLGAVVWVLSIVNFAFFLRACIADPPVANQAELGQIPAYKQEAPAPVYTAPQHQQVV
ncbi:hypothetical protein F503_01843 [Ophiostoma piceae UAMH 11346]|uniref:MARVEL domain-containing protein n=1 Tax=Ophiostoma piceae (strain UAMH 11346) TaxID=1262450 RepID=S3CSE6_OPHP1|nr:hypothetical protein F503_01843 [Ophiostoma piceae UAMH 11346]